MATVTYAKAHPDLPGHRRAPPSTSSTSTSPTASSSSWSARPAAASPPACACSPASRRSTRARSTSATRDVTNVPPKSRDIAMVFQNYALYPHMTVYENMALRAEAAQDAEGRDRPAGQGGRRSCCDLEEYLRPQAEGALRRPAPAGRDGPRDRARAAGLPHGRAAVEPRRQAARADPCPDRRAAAPARHHHGLRHPRPGRGDDHGRPGRGPAGRRAPAVRHAARAVRPPGQRLRRRLHRLAGDEHPDGAADRRRRRASAGWCCR